MGSFDEAMPFHDKPGTVAVWRLMLSRCELSTHADSVWTKLAKVVAICTHANA